MLIIFVDTVFDADLTMINRIDADGIIWAKEVEDYQRFGVVVTDERGLHDPDRREAVGADLEAGQHRPLLHPGLRGALAAGSITPWRRPANKGEFFLTDAFQYMIEHGRKILTAEVAGWYDCGKVDMFVETNEILLGKGAARHPALGSDVTIVEPVLIEDGVTIARSTIGPNVTIERGSSIADSTIAHTLMGQGCRVTGSTLRGSMLGNRVTVSGFEGSLSVTDDSEVRG